MFCHSDIAFFFLTSVVSVASQSCSGEGVRARYPMLPWPDGLQRNAIAVFELTSGPLSHSTSLFLPRRQRR